MIIIVLTIVALLSIIFAYNAIFNNLLDESSSNDNNEYHELSNFVHTVRFKLTSSESVKDVSLSYTICKFSMDYDEYYVPFEMTYGGINGDWMYMSAQNNGYDGWIQLELYVDDVLIESDTSHSDYGIVTVSSYV